MQEIQKRIYEQESFEQAKDLVLGYIDKYILSKNEKLSLIKCLESKVENEYHVVKIFEYYEQLGDKDNLIRYADNCLFQDAEIIKIKRTKIKRLYDDLSDAWDILDTQRESEYSLIQRAAILRQAGNFLEARRTIEYAMLKYTINSYGIKTYTAIINDIMKDDEGACRLVIPSLARDCVKENFTSFDFKRLLKKIIEHESHKKTQTKITQKILAKYEELKG